MQSSALPSHMQRSPWSSLSFSSLWFLCLLDHHHSKTTTTTATTTSSSSSSSSSSHSSLSYSSWSPSGIFFDFVIRLPSISQSLLFGLFCLFLLTHLAICSSLKTNHYTSPKINMSPEQGPFSLRKCHLPTINFKGIYQFSGGVRSSIKWTEILHQLSKSFK